MLKQENDEMKMEISGMYIHYNYHHGWSHYIIIIIFHNFHNIDKIMRIIELMQFLEKKYKEISSGKCTLVLYECACMI